MVRPVPYEIRGHEKVAILHMGSFGERLRREREMRGVTLDEISSSTKIARRHLEALERENFDALPGGVFNRGFVRAYARFLGIDEEQAVADYAEASGELTRPEPSFPIEIQPHAEPQLNPRKTSLPLVVALLALVIVLAIFWARNKRQAELSESSPAASTPAATPSSPSSSSLPAPDATAAPSASPELPASAAASPTAAPSSSSRPAQAPLAVEPVSTPSPSPQRTFSVMVEAKEEAWITVTADGRLILSGKTLKAGDHQVVRAGKKIVLMTGNAGGIEISFNGKSLGPVGNESEFRSLTFTPAGLVQ